MDEAMRIERTGIYQEKKRDWDNSTNSALLRLACCHFRSIHTYNGGKQHHETKEASQRQKDLNVHRSGLALNVRIIKTDNSKIIRLIQTNTITPQIKNNLF